MHFGAGIAIGRFVVVFDDDVKIPGFVALARYREIGIHVERRKSGRICVGGVYVGQSGGRRLLVADYNDLGAIDELIRG